MRTLTTFIGLLSGVGVLLTPGLDSISSKLAKVGMLSYASTLGVVWLRKYDPTLAQLEESINVAQHNLNVRAEEIQNSAQEMVAQAQADAEYWRQNYLACNAPVLPTETWTTAGQVCMTIQQALYQLGITLDCNREQPGHILQSGVPGGGYYLVNLYFRDQDNLVKYLDNKTKILPILECALNNAGGVKVVVEGKCLQIKFNPAERPSSHLYKDLQSQTKSIQVKSLDDLMAPGVGYLICGNSGSGKSSTAKVIAGQYQDAQGIIIDVHASANSWDDLGGTVVSEPGQIFETVDKLRTLYKTRKTTPKPPAGYPRVVVIWDEFEESLEDLQNYLDFDLEYSQSEIKREIERITNFVRSLATGGRKYGITLLVLNQSWNVSSLKINSGHRKNFVCIFLNAEMDRYLNATSDTLPNVDKSKYRALATGAIATQVVPHPTHQDYDSVANLQPPKVFPQFQLSPLLT